MKRTSFLTAVGVTIAALIATGTDAATREEIAAALEKHFEIFIIHPDRRPPGDRTVVEAVAKGGLRAEISHCRSLESRTAAEERCTAIRWLLFGRGSYGKGAADAFEAFPDLREITLAFYDVESGTKRGTKKGEILPTQKPVTYLKVSVTPASVRMEKVDWHALEKRMDQPGGCAAAEKYLSSQWRSR